MNAARHQCNFDAAVLGATRTEYRYDNTTNHQTGVMYECRGQVSYQYRDTTSYHGNFVENHDVATVVVVFDCKGDRHNLKSTVLLKRPDGSYSGWDYAVRWVVLTKSDKADTAMFAECGESSSEMIVPGICPIVSVCL